MSPVVSNDYRDRCNSGYDEKYSQINFHAIAGYSSLNFVNKIVNDDEFNCADWLKAIVTTGNVVGLDNALVMLVKLGGLIGNIGDLTDNEFWNVVNILDEIIVKGDWDIFTGEWTVYDDLFINVESQLAYEYEGANIKREWRKFTIFDGDLDKVSQRQTSIVHNLEARDKKIIKYILSNIRTGSALEYMTSARANNTVSIEGYYGALPTSSYIIPNTVQNKTVSEIGYYAYANDFYNKNITSVTIPASVTRIENGAFFDCTHLENIIFETGSQLEYIGAEAFAGCTSLTSITLPESVIEIGSEAFAGCTSLVSFVVGKNVINLSTDAFIGCTSLSAYGAHNENIYFSSNNGVLFR